MQRVTRCHKCLAAFGPMADTLDMLLVNCHFDCSVKGFQLMGHCRKHFGTEALIVAASVSMVSTAYLKPLERGRFLQELEC